MDRRVTIKVEGLVQGVSYRYNTRKVAQRLGVVGTIANMRDGSVEVVAEGNKQVLDELVSWCKEGPSYARVDRLYIDWSEGTGEFHSFTVL